MKFYSSKLQAPPRPVQAATSRAAEAPLAHSRQQWRPAISSQVTLGFRRGRGGLGPNRSKRKARHCRTHARAVSFVSAEEASLRRGRGARESTGGGGDAVHASSVASMKRSSFILKSKTGRACGGLDAANSRCHYCGTSLTCREYSPSSGSSTEGLLRAEAFAAFGFSCGGFARVLLLRRV